MILYYGRVYMSAVNKISKKNGQNVNKTFYWYRRRSDENM